MKKEILTYKFFYLLHKGITALLHCLLFSDRAWENNFQNINILFVFVAFSKIISENMSFDLFKVSFPIIKLFIFYFHLLIYGEFILSISDLLSLFFIILMISVIICFIRLEFGIYTNYYYCFNNKIVNNNIVIENTKSISKIKITIFMFSLIFYNIIFNKYICKQFFLY